MLAERDMVRDGSVEAVRLLKGLPTHHRTDVLGGFCDVPHTAQALPWGCPPRTLKRCEYPE
jgi:hypothetical protein